MSFGKRKEQKNKQFFWFSLGVLYEFSQKSNEDEFFRKSNVGWRPLEQIQKTQGGRKNIIFLVFFLRVLYGFSHKSNEDEFSRIRTITYVSIL